MATTATVAPTPDATLAERTRRRITMRLAPFLFVLYILNYLDRVNVSFASLQRQQTAEAAHIACGDL